jgi:hypothetical protein
MLSARVPECRHRSSYSARRVSASALSYRSAAAWQRGCACAANSAERCLCSAWSCRTHGAMGRKPQKAAVYDRSFHICLLRHASTHCRRPAHTESVRGLLCKSSAKRQRYLWSSSWSSQRSQKPFACCRRATHSKHLIQWPQARSNHQLWTKQLLSSTLCAPSCAVRQMVARPALMQQLPAAQQWMLPRQ